MELVSEQGFCTIAELSSALEVSEMTVRRDVGRLAREGKVRRVHGGVTALPSEALNPSDFAVRAASAREAKRAIAREALRFIRRPRATIGIDSGTTVLELAKILPEDRRLTVATHSLPAMVAMSKLKQVHVFGLGGELHPETQDFAGPATLEAIRDLRIGTLFLAAGGLSRRGVYCESDHEALVKRALIEVSERVVLLADSSKFGSSAMVRVCGLDAVDHAVIDDAITAADAALLADNGVDLRRASLSDHPPTDDPR
ncbi:MAG: DeoR/GlpR transcriptional regulator [Micromonosporaceae bacterium]|nr:DeoR/GlpR transcriptional regulator [Micromonosporaceae bacterium]